MRKRCPRCKKEMDMNQECMGYINSKRGCISCKKKADDSRRKRGERKAKKMK